MHIFIVYLCICPAVYSQTGTEPGKDYAYWKGTHEEWPGLFLCRTPAATGITVVCDRWPDTTDLRNFANDACRLSNADTPQEKALAVWRWTRRIKVHTNGNPPSERLAQTNSYVTDPVKVLNVYGAHFCGGLSRVAEVIWRAKGERADRVHCGSHSMVDFWYMDSDGKARYHLFDVNFGGFMYHSSRKRLMGLDDWTADYAGGKISWTHCDHWPWPTHRMELSLRKGEKLVRLWDNIGKPYQDNMDPKRDAKRTPLSERGPYRKRKYGNGIWTYSPGLSGSGWTEGLAEPLKEMVPGKLIPKTPGEPGYAVWHFRTPYIVSEAKVSIKAFRKSNRDMIKLYLSVDNGKTWKKYWEAPAGKIGEQAFSVLFDGKFEVNGGGSPPKDFNSPFGYYAYRLKLELTADTAGGCRVDDIGFETTVQQNFYALPQLQPGKNKITVRGNIEKGNALKVAYIWDDTAGKNRKNVTIIEHTPYTYEIIAGGKIWKDCVCRSLTVEAVSADGKGNRSVIKETKADYLPLPPLSPVHTTRGRRGWWQRASNRNLPSADKLKADIKKGSSKALKLQLEARYPQCFDAIKKVIYETQNSHTKMVAVSTLYVTDRERAKSVYLDIIRNRDKVKWIEKPVKKGPRNALQHWTSLCIIISVLAKDAGWKDMTPDLVNVAEKGSFGKHIPKHALIRALASLADDRAKETFRKELRRRGYSAAWAAVGAARIGDREALPAIRNLLNSKSRRYSELAAIALGILKDRESIPALRKVLEENFYGKYRVVCVSGNQSKVADENLRAAAAEALGNIGDRGSLDLLKKALEKEPFEWVRKKIKNAIDKIQKS